MRTTLDRLPAQIDAYNAVFDEVTIVVGVRHLARAETLLPRWWGVTRASALNNKLRLSVLRDPEINPLQNSRAVAELLWRDEAIELLTRHSKLKGLSRLNRKSLTEKMTEVVDRDTVCRYARAALKSRVGWRVDEQRTICDGLFPLVSR